MSLTISEEVKQRLAPFLTETNTFLLVANDGSNPYSSAEGCCMIGDRFIIVPVDQAEAPYTETIANDSFTSILRRMTKCFNRAFTASDSSECGNHYFKMKVAY